MKQAKQMKQYSHLMDVGFTVISKHKDYTKIKPEDILEALGNRFRYLEKHPEECVEAFGFSDTIEAE
jgi:uncharacterized protein YifE (UPF0438 family)